MSGEDPDFSSIDVSREGLLKLMKAVENPKQPPPALVEMLRERNGSKPANTFRMLQRPSHGVRLAVARAIGASAGETNHMVRADQVIQSLFSAMLSEGDVV